MEDEIWMAGMKAAGPIALLPALQVGGLPGRKLSKPASVAKETSSLLSPGTRQAGACRSFKIRGVWCLC